jgi:RimJ/RimL family protein N-acetyltransferase
MVGDLCFVGEPDAKGEVEIGYGTYEEFRKMGYMTEAVGGMIKWAQKQADIRSIIASTGKTNIDSFSVLERNNFIKSGETETLYHWILKII